MTVSSQTLWRHADFLRLWSAQGLSLCGSKLSELAIPLMAATMLNATPLQMGMLLAAENLPFLLFGLPAGAWIDRVHKRPVMVGADLLRALLLLCIPVGILFGWLSLSLLLVLAFGVGVLNVGFDLAYGSYLPTLVARDRLVDANSKLSISSSAAETAGPAVAGLLIQVLGAPVAMLIDAVSYLISALLLHTIRSSEAPLPPPPPGEKLRHTIVVGLRFVWTNLLMRALTVRLACWQFVVTAAEALLILYMTKQLAMSAATVGIMFSIAGLGVFVGAMVGDRLPRRLGMGKTICLVQLILAVLAFCLPLAALLPAAVLALAGLTMFVWGFCAITYQINNVALRQALSPAGMLTKVNAATRCATLGMRPISAVAAGALATAVGLQAALICVLVLGLVLALAGYWSTYLGPLFDLPEEAIAPAPTTA